MHESSIVLFVEDHTDVIRQLDEQSRGQRVRFRLFELADDQHLRPLVAGTAVIAEEDVRFAVGL